LSIYLFEKKWNKKLEKLNVKMNNKKN
jgi:hypothetical protein